MSKSDRKLEDEIAAHERWLRGYPTPAPSAEALERTRRAVRQELERGALSGGLRRRFSVWRGFAGVAAVVALGVTLGWYSTRPQQPQAPPADIDGSLSSWLADANDELVRFARIDEGLSELEDWSADEYWTANGSFMYEAMDSALESESDKDAEQGGAMAPTPLSASWNAGVV